MIADYFTKALQGTKFRDFGNFIMNVDPSTDSVVDRRSVLGIIKLPVNSPGTQNKVNGVGADAHIAQPRVHPIRSPPVHTSKSNRVINLVKASKGPKRRR
jgi:hypothetical protein